jgi:ferrous iron transport protein A
LIFVFTEATVLAFMSLAEVAIGTVVVVEEVGGERAFRRRLMELGLLPGTRVEVKGVAPLGDPIELLVRGSSLSIRRAEARLIGVRSLGSESPSPVERGVLPPRADVLAAVAPGSEVRGSP